MIFGSYPQSMSGMTAPVEWQVLERKRDRALLVSRYILDRQSYHRNRTAVTWETCSLRTWLNGTFLKTAFSAEERAKIATTTVSADKNPEYGEYPGNATKDKTFLLSITEAEKYFTTDEARKCALTAYAEAQGAYASNHSKTASGEATTWWWLRTIGSSKTGAASVNDDGSVEYSGYVINSSIVAVRPALWIDLKA